MNYLGELDEMANLIKDRPLKQFTLTTIHAIPITIWSMPSSFNHHLQDERGPWGNAIHSLRVTGLARILADCLLITGIQLDALTSAGLLHDIGKRGLHGDDKYLMNDHHLLARPIIEGIGESSEDWEMVLHPIEAHMGRWTKGEVPEFLKTKYAGNDMVLHLADCIVARWAEVMPEGDSNTTGEAFKPDFYNLLCWRCKGIIDGTVKVD